MKIDPTTFKKIMLSLTLTQEEEIGCEECYQHMDRFAEMLMEGQDPAAGAVSGGYARSQPKISVQCPCGRGAELWHGVRARRLALHAGRRQQPGPQNQAEPRAGQLDGHRLV